MLGLELDESTLGPPASDDRNVALLRAARAAGVTTWAIAEGAAGARAERLISAALPAPDPDLVVIARRSIRQLANGEPRASAVGSDLEARLRSSLEASNERLSPHSVSLLEWRDDPSDPPESETAGALDRLRSGGSVQDWLTSVPNAVERWSNATGEPDRPTLVVGPLSLLDRSTVVPLRTRAERHPVGLFVRNPLADGRLDGSRFERPLADRGPGVPPPTVRELHREFDPVLALGFLSEGRRRTLAQSSLQFAAHWPWVCSILVPLPRPERLRELLDAETRPPLSEDEVARVLQRTGAALEGEPPPSGLK